MDFHKNVNNEIMFYINLIISLVCTKRLYNDKYIMINMYVSTTYINLIQYTF